ncbi:uncharacterized protein LOC143230171 [Tachypleus tridentatus]|uniref:uncharacterized protein LOC143230171 n=1 Tax=Tachypleus tridentatus TaxID=6853 RepID=UPI003FCF94E0
MIKQSSSFLPNNKDSSEVLVKHYSFTHKEITHSSVDKNLRRDTLGVPVEELDKTFGLQPQDDVSQPTSFLEHSLVINNNQQKDVTASNKLCKNLVAMEGEEPQVRLTSSASFFQHSQSQDSFPALSPSSSGINIKREPVLSYDEELSNVVTETRCSTFPSNKQSTFSQQQHEVTNYPTKFYHHGRWRNNIRSYHHLRYERDPLSRRPMCPVCGKTFYNVSNCKRHLEIHLILRKKFSCPFCVRTFSWKTTLMTHLRAFHNQEPDPSQFTGT